MSGIPENPMIDTQKNKNMPLLCRKWYQFIVRPWTNGGHLVFFTHNAMSKIFSDNTTMSGIHENPRIDTKNSNISLLCQKWYQFIVWPWTNGGHLGLFTHNAMLKIYSDNTTMSGIHENPRIDTKKREYAFIMSKMISIYCLTSDKWRPSWIFYPQCNVENIVGQWHCVGHTL